MVTILIMSGGNALTVGDTESGGFAGGDYNDGEVSLEHLDVFLMVVIS